MRVINPSLHRVCQITTDNSNHYSIIILDETHKEIGHSKCNELVATKTMHQPMSRHFTKSDLEIIESWVNLSSLAGRHPPNAQETEKMQALIIFFDFFVHYKWIVT